MRTLTSNKMVLVGIGLAILYWILEAAIHVFIFQEGHLARNLYPSDPNEIWMRSLTALLLVIFGVHAQFAINRYERTKTALAEKTTLLDNILRSSADFAIATVDLDYRITYYNPMAEKLFGYTAEEVIGKTVQEMHTREKVESERFEKAVHSIRSCGEYRYTVEQKTDEGTRYLDSRASGIWDPDGELVGYALFSRDVTRERATQDALIRAKEEWEWTFDAVPDLIAILDDRHRIVRVNKAMAERVGMTPEQCVGQPCYRCVHGTDEPPEDCVHSQLLVDGREHSSEQYEEGLRGHFHVTATPLRDAEGHPVGCVHIARDITERKRAEEALRGSEERYRHLVELTPDGIVFGKNGQIEFANNAFASMLGYASPDEVVGRCFLDFVKPHLHEEVQTRIRDFDAGLRAEQATEDIYLRADGSELPVEAIGTRFDLHGERYGMVMVRDITERKRAEEALREGEERFRAIAENIPGVVYSYDHHPDGRRSLIFVGPGLEELLGEGARATLDESVDRFYDLIHPEDREGLQRAAADAIDTGRPADQEYRVRMETGDYQWVHSITRPIPQDGGVIRWHGVLIDVSERKRAEDDLRREKELAKMYLDIVGVILVVINAQERITLINRRGCEVLGYDVADIQSENWFDCFIPQRNRESVRAVFSRLMTGEAAPVDYFENPVLTKSGEERFVAWHNTVLYDEAGNITGTLSSGEDITERKRAEEALREQEVLLRGIIEGTDDLVFVKDCEGRYLMANSADARSFGLTVDQVVGRTDKDLFPSELARSIMEIDRDIIATGRGRTYEQQFSRPGTPTRTYSVSKFPNLNPDGSTAGVIGIARDITERKRMEETLRESEEKWRSLVENAPNYIMIVSRDGAIRFINRTQPHVTPGEVAGSIYDYLLPEDRPVANDAIQHVFRTAESTSYEARVEHEGQLMWFDNQVGPIERDGQVVAAIVIATDITERKRAEQALRDSEQRYRLLFEHNLAGVYRTKLDGTIMDVNESLVEMFGYTSREELLSCHASVLYLETTDRTDVLAQLRKDGILTNSEFRMRRKDGTPIDILENVSLLPDEHGAPAFIYGTIVDITDRKRAEEETRRLAAAVKHSSELVNLATMAGKMIFLNDAGGRMLGIDPQDVEHVNIMDVIPEPWVELVESDLLPTLMRGDVWDGDLQYRNLKTGKLTDVHAMTFTVKDTDTKEPQFLANVSMDITDRRRAEQALRESEEKLRNIVEHSTNVFYSHTTDHVLTYMSPQTSSLLDCEPEECLHEWMDFITDNPMNKKGFEHTQAAIDTGERQPPYELELVGKKGRKVWVEVREAPLVRDGKTVAIVGALTDVTERKRAAEELRKERDFSTTLLQSSPTFFVAISAEGQTLMMNETMLTGLGYAEDEVVGTNYLETFVPGSDRELLAEVFERLVQSNEATLNENRVLTKDGRELLVEWYGRPIFKENGEFDFFFGVGIDITERKKVEHKLAEYRDHLEELVEKRTRELEESREKLHRSERLASVGTLAAGIAHEINNPIGGIALAAQNALELKDKPDTEALLETCLKDIVAHAEHCGQITRSVLQFAKQERTDKQAHDINEIIERAVTLTDGYVAEHGSLTEQALAEDLPKVLVNTFEIEQVIVNLIHNAVESSLRGVRVLIRTEKTPDAVRIVVQDNGRGIPMEQVKRLFDPFFTTRQKRGGSGLGLSIAHGIISGYGGTIDVESRVGTGTAFTITLPLAPAHGKETSRTPGRGRAPKMESIHGKDPDRR